MAEVSAYRVGGKNLTEILQDSVNRNYITFANYKLNGNNIAFARYNSNYHVFNPDTNINAVLKHETSTANKGENKC